MRIETKNLEVILGEGAEQALVVFAPMKVNAATRLRAEMAASETDEAKQDALLAYRQAILDGCIKVENLFENDIPITPEILKGGDLCQSTLEQVMTAYMLAVNPPAPEAEQKNDESGSDS